MRLRRAILSAAGCVVVAVAVAILAPLPAPVELPPTGLDILDRHGRLLYRVIDSERGASRPVTLDDIAPALRLATVAVEDASFDTNPGIDLLANLRALGQDIQERRVVAGGSTITQQLARLRYLPADRRSAQTAHRKLEESWLALRLTQVMRKADILQAYLNSAPYGNLAVGAETAAWTYFAKPVRELSLAEAALLAGLPQSPTDYDPFTHFEAARARQRVVLDLMQRRGMLLPSDVQAARDEPIRMNDRPFPLSAAHFVDYVRSLAPPGALRVWTTLDRDLQATTERAAQRQVALLADHDVSDAAVVVLDPRTGEVLAMVGGVDYFDDQQPAAQINMAVMPRQPGSAFKPITYAAAFESARFSQASTLDDERTVFHTRSGETYVPENYDHQFHGPVPLRVALASSLNVPAVQVLARVGLGPVLSLSNAMGLPLGDSDVCDLSLTLGGADLPLLDLTSAYGAFATGGIWHPTVAIIRAEDAEGRTVAGLAHGPGSRVMSVETAWLIDDILSDDAARGPGFGRNGVLHVAGRTVAVKTGTTSDFRDNWTIGFTPDVVVGVWVGNADNRPMRDVSGVTGAAPLWRDVFEVATDSMPPRAFDRPTALQQVELCADSEDLAGPNCPLHRLEWVTPAYTRSAAQPQPPLRITFPDPGTVFELDPRLPSAAQQLAVEVETTSVLSQVDLTVDGIIAGRRIGSGTIAWQPTPGRHFLHAESAGIASESTEIEVVPF
jgi:penicillin-binding protein 1C